MNARGLWAALVISILVGGSIVRYSVGQDESGAEDEETLPIGLLIHAQIKELIAERLVRIHELIMDHKLEKAEQNEEKLQLILQFHEMIRDRNMMLKQELEDLRRRFENGEITQEEYRMEMERLKSEFREQEGSFLHLGQQLKALMDTLKDGGGNLGQQISAVNKEIHEQMAAIRDEMKEAEKAAKEQESNGKGKGHDNDNNSNNNPGGR